jgi:hypothetical protein
MKPIFNVFFVVFIILMTSINVLAESDSSYIDINLTGTISGSYLIKNLNVARIQNPAIAKESTIGLFSDPPSIKYPFDIAMILGNLGNNNIEIGVYQSVEVLKDVPNLQIGHKGGFMTIVPTEQNPPKVEYFTTSGNFVVVEIIEKIKISGTFDLQLKSTDGSKVVNATGNFSIYINE